MSQVRALLLLVIYVLVAGVGLLAYQLREKGADSSMGLRKEVEWGVAIIMKSKSRLFDLERRLFERYGNRYICVKNIIVGGVFVLYGISVLSRVLLRRIPAPW